MLCAFTTDSAVSKLTAYLEANVSMAVGMIVAYSWQGRGWRYVVALAAAAGCMQALALWHEHRKIKEPRRAGIGILLSQVALLLCMYAVGMAVARVGNDSARVGLMLLILLLSVLLFFLQRNISRTAEKEYEEERRRQQETGIQDILSVYEDVKRQEKELRGLSQRLDNLYLQGEVMEEGEPRICKNELVNRILGDKRLLAKQYGCELEISVRAEELPEWDSIDFISLLVNVLDNSIEAAAKVQDRDRVIRVEGEMDKKVFRLRVSNPYAGELLMENGRWKTTKTDAENHGYGTLQIKHIAEKYRKTMSVHTGNQQFTVEIQ